MGAMRFLRKVPLSTVAGLALSVVARLAFAGDLNAEVNTMFNDLGSIGNITSPGAFRGQVYNTYTGGNLFFRAPNKVYQLAAIQFPSAKGGCGGIDVFGGSFSHISAAEFKNVLKNITAALPGIAFQLALDSVSSELGGITKWAKSLESMINNARINSCETARALVTNPLETMGYAAQEMCATVAVATGQAADADAARRLCATDRPAIMAGARASTDPTISSRVSFVGNLTYKALERVTALDPQQREMIMGMVGTTIYPAEVDGLTPEPDKRVPTLTSMRQLLYGDSDAANGAVNMTVLHCVNGETDDCAQVVTQPYVHTPFTKFVEDLMQSIATKIRTRAPLPNNSQEVGFINMTSEPVYRMLSIGNAIPGSGLSDVLINQYRDLIAADYAYTFLERNLRTAMDALGKQYLLDKEQRVEAERIRSNARALLEQLAQEKVLLYGQVRTFSSVATHLEQLERQMRTSMPQHVMDMLGQQAVYMGK